MENINIYNLTITQDQIHQAEKVLMDNGIDEDDAYVVLQALGYVLLDAEFYPEDC